MSTGRNDEGRETRPAPRPSGSVLLKLTLTLTLPLVFVVTLTLPPTLALAPSGCIGDCSGNGQVTVDEVLTLVNVALENESATACPSGDANGDGRITIDEILTAVNAALSGCPRRILDLALVFGGGPGGTTFVPLVLSADGIVTATIDLCFVDGVFSYSPEQTFSAPGVVISSANLLDGSCALDDATFPSGRTLRVELAGEANQPIPSGDLVTLAFNVAGDAATGCYPAAVTAKLRDTGNHEIVEALRGVMTVFAFLGEACQSDCACLSTFCRDGLCCEESCQGGTCNPPGSEGTCVR